MNLSKYKNVLVLAVGGGNDSVSTLLLQLQLNKTFKYSPNDIDIVAVLPDCLDYHNLDNTEQELVSIITPNSSRSVQNKKMNAFPEKVLSENKDVFPELNINHVYGVSMKKGSYGIYSALENLITKNNYDLVLSIDVGGDFIACKENIEVLSPMMDGYMLFALKSIKQKFTNVDFVFSIFGLGTDGESSPYMLKKAISKIRDIKEYSFVKEDIKPFISFYRNIVEKNRYSRTTDYTILEIENKKHDNPSNFRGRFHVKISETDSNKYYGYFKHIQSEEFYGKFYLFTDIDNIDNNYCSPSNNGVEWFINVQNQKEKINHELNGQSYNNLNDIFDNEKLKNISLFFGTPSRKFNKELQIKIVEDIFTSINNSIYDLAFIYEENLKRIPDNIYFEKINNDLILISKKKENINFLLKNM